ncbi:hypothetical protein D3C85_1254960 [compost metagenome]
MPPVVTSVPSARALSSPLLSRPRTQSISLSRSASTATPRSPLVMALLPVEKFVSVLQPVAAQVFMLRLATVRLRSM